MTISYKLHNSPTEGTLTSVIKFDSTQSDLNLFIKLSFVLGFSIINSHPGVFINFLMFIECLSLFVIIFDCLK